MIQAVTWIYPRSLEVTKNQPLKKVTFLPQKRSQSQNCQVFSSFISFDDIETLDLNPSHAGNMDLGNS